MSRSKIAGNIAAVVFVYLLIYHFSTFAAFWTPLLAGVDLSGNIAALAALATPFIIAVIVGTIINGGL